MRKEVEEIVEPGVLQADEIHLPDVYVHIIFKPSTITKKNWKINVRLAA